MAPVQQNGESLGGQVREGKGSTACLSKKPEAMTLEQERARCPTGPDRAGERCCAVLPCGKPGPTKVKLINN